MKDQKQGVANKTLSRRRFLVGAATTAPAIASVVMLPGAANAVEATATKTADSKGYHLTPHILAYYKTTAL